MIGLEIEKEDITYNKNKNRIIVVVDDGGFKGKIQIAPQVIRDFLPTMDENEKLKDLFMIIHDLEREKLARMRYFIGRMKELEKGIGTARTELEKCDDMTCVKKWQAVIKSYVDAKNALAEIRRTITLLEKNKQPLLMRIAKLGRNPEEYL